MSTLDARLARWMARHGVPWWMPPVVGAGLGVLIGEAI